MQFDEKYAFLKEWREAAMPISTQFLALNRQRTNNRETSLLDHYQYYCSSELVVVAALVFWGFPRDRSWGGGG